MELLRLACLLHPQSLSMKQLGDLAPHATEHVVARGQRVLLDGPFGQELVFVGSGTGRMRCAGEPIGELGPGDAFGALAAARTVYATATVMALTELRLVMFSAGDLRRLGTVVPATVAALLAACESTAAPAVASPRLTLVPPVAA